jgi:hypothetical protein
MGILPPKPRTFRQDFLPALLAGTLKSGRQQSQQDYETKMIMDILSGVDPRTAIAQPQGGLFSKIIGGQPSTSNLSPFTQQVLSTMVAQKLEDPLARRGRLANVIGTETQTEGMREDIAASRETRPLKLKSMRQEIDAREKEIAFIEQTNPERAKALRNQNAQIEQQLEENRKKLPLELQNLQLSIDIAKENLSQTSDLAPVKKQYLQAQLDEATNAIDTNKKMTPLEIQQLEATIENIKANTEYIKGGKGKGTEPYEFNELSNASKFADQVLITAKRGWLSSVGRYDYPKEALQSAYKRFIVYAAPKTQEQMDQLNTLWKSKMKTNEFEWSDDMFGAAGGAATGNRYTSENSRVNFLMGWLDGQDVQIQMPNDSIWTVPEDKADEAVKRGGKRL